MYGLISENENNDIHYFRNSQKMKMCCEVLKARLNQIIRYAIQVSLAEVYGYLVFYKLIKDLV
jgi:hypothetical protein